MLLPLLAGCAVRDARLTPLERTIAEAARPILEMDPDAVWTDSFNTLVELAPASIRYLAEHETLRRPAAPDDLRVMLHTSLLRMLANPATRPRLTANCLETSLDLLHFDLKVGGDSVGTPLLADRQAPACWHDLYPADLDRNLADQIDAEADRRAMLQWWHEHRGNPQTVAAGMRLTPKAERLWRLLSRRYADRWTYQPGTTTIQCSQGSREPVMILADTYDYNLVRAACVWLGSSPSEEIRGRLIDLVASPSQIVVHNAILALRHAPDRRIRELLERYNGGADEPTPRVPTEPAVPRRMQT